MENKNPNRVRTLAFVISGLIDCLFGGILLLAWLGFLPLDLGIPHTVMGLLGGLLSVVGIVVVVFQLTKLRGPDE